LIQVGGCFPAFLVKCSGASAIGKSTIAPPLTKSMDFSDFSQLPMSLQAVVTYQDLAIKQALFHCNEAATKLYIVKFGSIRLLHYTESGQAISHYQVKPGEICAETVLFRATYDYEAIAEEPTQVLAFPKQSMLTELQQNAEFATACLRQTANRLHFTKVLLESRSIRSARERVIHYLRLIQPTQATIVQRQLLKNLAYDIGLSPEVLSRTLAQLEKEGTIARDKRNIVLMK
jgi:CRP/FNR family transcriptional regulator, dissimilatory nitrate respiration regulator